MSSVESKVRKERVSRSAKEKAQAVLALWTEHRKPAEICREMGLKYSVVLHWQERAMEGMLEALTPRTQTEERLPMLPRKVEKLLGRKSQEPLTRLTRRLSKLQAGPEEPVATPKG